MMRLTQVYQKFFGNRIAAGPFRGMRYGGDLSVGSSLGPKILGTYEMELRPVLGEVCAKRYDRIVNIGAGEGYYAVGLALRLPQARVVAFESDRIGQQLIAHNALLNGVQERITVMGLCSGESLGEVLGGAEAPLVVIDVEGAELNLLDPAVVPGLMLADIICEIHDFVDRRCSKVIAERFGNTHDIQTVWSQDRTRADLPRPIFYLLSYVFRHQGLRWMNEHRPEQMQWFYMKSLQVRQAQGFKLRG